MIEPSTSSSARSADIPSNRSLLGRAADMGQVLVPGTYAWAVTVIPAATDPSQTRWALVPAVLGLGLLIAGTLYIKARPRLAMALGIWGFLIASLITWLLTLPSLHIERLDPWRASAGSIGWLLFALGWGTPWRIGHHPEDDPRAQLHPKLEARKPPRLRSAISVGVGSLGALTCLLLAWRASEPGRALLLHGTALACAVGIIHASAHVGLAQGKRRKTVAPKQRFTYAFPWLMAIVALMVIALAWLLGR